ncbi:MAG: hybrid sensor histidine kinase/response regulator [Desulfobacteraceae bacterium]|nr:MAG: hybrid sensor histidine kinase/response regulator [Desulfobacteraceae bacterium]
MYNRLEGELLCSVGQWHIPPGFKAADASQGHICYDVIQSNTEEAVIVRDLPHSVYQESDPNVRAYGLKTYMGHLVKSSGQIRGSLCVAYQIDFLPSQDDQRILGILASAVGNEDSHWQAEKELVESKTWFDTILQNVSAGVIVIDAEDHRIVDCNALAVKMIGTPKEKIVGSVCHRFSCPAQQGDCPITDRGQTADNAERVLLTADGQSIPILKTVIKVAHKGRNYLMESFLDNSARKQAEEERLRLESQLQKSQKLEAIGTLAGGIAHDFNNILYAIIGNAEMSLYDLPEASPARYPVEQVLKASFRARDLVRQILAFSRQAEKEIKPVQVNMIVKEALKLLRATLPATIEIRHRMSALRNTVLGDPTQIHQVVMNLCTNAHHAMLEKGGTLEVNMNDVDLDAGMGTKYPGLKPGSYLKLAITDTGQGMRPEIRERIFDPYFTTKDKSVGTGLGLAVVHGIVKDLGGIISVHSEPGQGSTFEVFLPLVHMESLPEIPAPEAIPRGRERILFVDDEEDIANLALRILEHLGYKVVVKTGSIQALEAFKADPDCFDLIITDMTMPQMTGDRLATAVMALRPGMPVILCTGYSERISEKQAKALGIKAFVMKPLVMREIAKTIRQVLDE